MPRIFDGAAEAKLIALACSRPPFCRKRWTLQLLEEAVEPNIVERASDNTIGGTLKNTLKPHLQRKQWVIPPDANASVRSQHGRCAGVGLSLAARFRSYSVVCLDETSKQLISETRVPIKVKPGQPARHDYEYERNGTANLFMMFAPLEGWRHVAVTDRHTAVDFCPHPRAICPIRISPQPRSSCPWRTTSTPTNQRHSTKHSLQPKLVALPSGSNGTTRRNTAVGSIWPKSSSACCRVNVLIDVSPTRFNLIEEVAARGAHTQPQAC